MRGIPHNHFNDLVSAIEASVRLSPSEVRSHDDPTVMRVGFTHAGVWHHIAITRIKMRNFDARWEEHLKNSLGRKVIANCLSHGHGPEEIPSCRDCFAAEVMEA